MARKILELNGPNLSLSGAGAPRIYGSATPAGIGGELSAFDSAARAKFACSRSRHERAPAGCIQAAGAGTVIINAGAPTRSSIAVRDKLAAMAIPSIEMHLSNVQRRGAFGHHAVAADLTEGAVAGLAADGYRFARQYALDESRP